VSDIAGPQVDLIRNVHAHAGASLFDMAVSAPQFTAEQLARMPDDDGHSYELVRGELLVMSKPKWLHGLVSANICAPLWGHVRRTKCGVVLAGDIGFQLEHNPDTVRAPDVAFVSSVRSEEMLEASKFVQGSPDLAVEVVSPNDRPRAVREKAAEWLEGGAIAVLVIDPAEQMASVYRQQGKVRVFASGDTLDLSDAVPGFGIAVDELFA
jgi:Uma2 family endonuclease